MNGTVLADGPDNDGVLDEPTFVVRAGESRTFSASAEDPGSDDLTFLWNWGDTTTSSFTDFASPSGPDALPSPEVNPRDIFMDATKSRSKACLYQVTARVADDDGGFDADETWVVVTGVGTKIEAPGKWYNEFDSKKNRTSIDTQTLDCYLKIVRHMSRVFNLRWFINNATEARDVLNTKQTSRDTEIMQRQLLGAWLNFAHGSIRWFDLVDTNRDGIPDTVFHQLLSESEELRLNPAATRAQLLAQEDKLKSANGD